MVRPSSAGRSIAQEANCIIFKSPATSLRLGRSHFLNGPT